jgi:hypothetical protein
LLDVVGRLHAHRIHGLRLHVFMIHALHLTARTRFQGPALQLDDGTAIRNHNSD